MCCVLCVSGVMCHLPWAAYHTTGLLRLYIRHTTEVLYTPLPVFIEWPHTPASAAKIEGADGPATIYALLFVCLFVFTCAVRNASPQAHVLIKYSINDFCVYILVH